MNMKEAKQSMPCQPTGCGEKLLGDQAHLLDIQSSADRVPLKHGSLRNRFALFLGLLFLLYAVLGCIAYYSMRTSIHAFEQISLHEMQQLRQLVSLQKNISLLKAPLHQYLASFDMQEQQRYNSVINNTAEKFHSIINSKQLTSHQRSLVNHSYQEWQAGVNTGAEIFTLGYRDSPQLTGQLLNSLISHIDNARDTLHEAYHFNTEQIEDYHLQARQSDRLTHAIILAGFVIGFITFLAAIYSFSHFILNPARALLSSLDVIGQGNLSHRIPVTSVDEFGTLAIGLNRMAANLEKDQEQLAEMAIRDGLTGLYNRREFERLLADELNRFRRHGHAVSLMMIDADNFKQINDRYGHQIGDDVLRTIGEIITRQSRTGDIVARFGGEELAVILPETNATSAAILAERTCQAIASFPVMVSPHEVIQVTVSVGVATTPQDAHSSRDLITAADLAMYDAKRSGRNCIRCASHPA